MRINGRQCSHEEDRPAGQLGSQDYTDLDIEAWAQKLSGIWPVCHPEESCGEVGGEIVGAVRQRLENDTETFSGD